MAVGRCLCHSLDPNTTASPATVLDHDRLAEQRSERIGQDASYCIHPATWREGHDQPDRPGGERLRPRCSRRGQGKASTQQGAAGRGKDRIGHVAIPPGPLNRRLGLFFGQILSVVK
jgi:hypothetical protein